MGDWFASIAEGRDVDDEVDFIEPNLRFLLLDHASLIRVYFELECRPSWAPFDGADMNDLWVDLNVNAQELTDAAASLCADLERFPIRVPYGTNV